MYISDRANIFSISTSPSYLQYTSLNKNLQIQRINSLDFVSDHNTTKWEIDKETVLRIFMDLENEYHIM